MKTVDMDWYRIQNADDIPSPQLLVYPARVQQNIRSAVNMLDDVNRLRPHIKTNKCAEVVQMMLDEGISKFKFATVEEGDLLGASGAKDALMAYQPVGPRMAQLAELIVKYPHTRYSCVVDHADVAKAISDKFVSLNMKAEVFIDVNVGMNRTGADPSDVVALYKLCHSLPGLQMRGLHAYDGHLRDPELEQRRKQCDLGFEKAQELEERIAGMDMARPEIIMGGSPSFLIHAQRKEVQCSPGTFVFWDKGYADLCKEQPFVPAAVVLTRVLSLPAADKICVDMGHKAIAAENDITRRAFFLDDGDLQLVGQSEEHGLVSAPVDHSYKPGDVLYVLPYHICPTVNLYSHMVVVENGNAIGSWQVAAKH